MSIENLPPEMQPSDDIAKLLGRAGELKAQLEANQLDREGLAEVRKNYDQIRNDINELQKVENDRQAAAERDSLLAEMKAMLAETRTPSRAHLIGSPEPKRDGDGKSFFATLAMARSPKLAGSIAAQKAAEDSLAEDFGSFWKGVDPASKATVGDTDAAGGYLVPNAVVADINLQATPGRAVVDLFNVINGVRGSSVDIPFEDTNSQPSRATIIGAGALKTNADFIVNNYTATLYTLAKIFDVGNQLLRQSEGAAEQYVRSRLARDFALGEDYYALQGSGSSEPYGLLTALGTSGTYVSSHTPSASTVAGNWASAVAKMAGAVAQRGGTPDGVVVNSGDYWTNLASGADAAGFYVDPQGGGFSFNGSAAGTTGAGPWGIRLRHTPNMPTDSAVVGEYRAAMFFRGQGYRVDVSSEAGTRWDYNLTGFRGEEEIAFDARPAVYTGHFQRVTNILP
jgi:HK97 family phage major capsid protein